jgi:hypothetical protein
MLENDFAPVQTVYQAKGAAHGLGQFLKDYRETDW